MNQTFFASIFGAAWRKRVLVRQNTGELDVQYYCRIRFVLCYVPYYSAHQVVTVHINVLYKSTNVAS